MWAVLILALVCVAGCSEPEGDDSATPSPTPIECETGERSVEAMFEAFR